jgi:hypothetical protein
MLLMNPFRFPPGGSLNPASGRYFITVDDNDVYTSTDLTSWTTIDMPGTLWWPGGITKIGSTFVIAPSGADGGGSSDYAATSTNGTSWTLRNAPTQEDAYGWVYCANNGSRVVALGNSDPYGFEPLQSAMYSDNSGTSWTMGSLEGSQWRHLMWVPSLSLFIATGGANGEAIATSTNGVSWTVRSTSGNISYSRAVFASGKYRAVGNNLNGSGTTTVLKSSNGTAYSTASAGVGLTFMQWTSTFWTGSKFVAAGWNSSTGLTYTIESSDGDSWTQNTATLPGNCTVIHDGNQYLAAAQNTISGIDLYFSVDLSTWALVTTITADYAPAELQFLPT